MTIELTEDDITFISRLEALANACERGGFIHIAEMFRNRIPTILSNQKIVNALKENKKLIEEYLVTYSTHNNCTSCDDLKLKLEDYNELLEAGEKK